MFSECGKKFTVLHTSPESSSHRPRLVRSFRGGVDLAALARLEVLVKLDLLQVMGPDTMYPLATILVCIED